MFNKSKSVPNFSHTKKNIYKSKSQTKFWDEENVLKITYLPAYYLLKPIFIKYGIIANKSISAIKDLSHSEASFNAFLSIFNITLLVTSIIIAL